MSNLARSLMVLGLGLADFNIAPAPIQHFDPPQRRPDFYAEPPVWNRPDTRSESVKAAAERYEAREWRGRSIGRRGRRR